MLLKVVYSSLFLGKMFAEDLLKYVTVSIDTL